MAIEFTFTQSLIFFCKLFHMIPFVPKKISEVEAGDFYSIPLSDGSFACGRLLLIERKNGRKTQSLLVGLHEWHGQSPPTSEDLHESKIIEQGVIHVKSIGHVGGKILGRKPLKEDGLKHHLQSEAGCLIDGFENVGKLSKEDWGKYSSRSHYGLDFIRLLAEDHFVSDSSGRDRQMVSIPTQQLEGDMEGLAESTFGNDTACDWIGSFLENPGLEAVRSTIQTVLDHGANYLDSDEASDCLAACEVISRLQGKWGIRSIYSEELDKWIELNPIAVPDDLKIAADSAIERILGADSELPELWDEGGRNDDWHKAIDDLRNRIRG